MAEFVDIYFEQANVFSAIVGILGTRALDAVSNYEKHRHADLAWQREIKHMEALGVKLELEALSNKHFSFITETYLPQKLKDKRWLD